MDLEGLLRDQNQHWLDKNYLPEEVNWYHRHSYYQEIINWLPKSLIISLTGLRRVGKSTLLKQIIAHLLKDHPPENIFYFSFDQSVVKNEPESLREILNFYASFIHQKPLVQIKKEIYIFLDEIQVVPAWQDVLKTYHDLNPNLQFIISGSSSLFISRKTTESLAGRLKEIVVSPLAFIEYLHLNPKTAKEIKKTSLEQYFHFYPDIVTTAFDKYLAIGQFPEPVKNKYFQEETREYLSTVENKILEVDLPQTFPIRRPDIVKIIFSYFKQSSGDLLLYENLTNDLGVNIRTTVKYIDWLRKAFLVDICLNHTKKLVKASRTAKKFYLASTNFSSNLPAGKMVETYIFNFLKGFGFQVEFLRFQNKEIDFITTTPKGTKIPWEVKYQEQIRKSDLKMLEKFAETHQSPYAFLVTKNQKGERKLKKTRLYLIPAFTIELTRPAILKKLAK